MALARTDVIFFIFLIYSSFAFTTLVGYDQTDAITAAQLSAVAYCDPDAAMKLDCPACSSINNTYVSLNMTEIHIEQGNHAFAVLKNDADRNIVVAFRGTNSPLEIVSQVAHDNAKYYQFSNNLPDGAKVQDYFYDVYTSLRPALRQVLTEVIKEYPDYLYVFTGHSLGGALTTLAASECLDSGLLPSVPKLYTFGEPRTSNYEFISWTTDNIPEYYRVTHYRDLVVHVPPCIPSTQGGCSTDPGVMPWAPFHGGTEIYYDDFNIEYLDLSGYESVLGAFQHVLLSIYDHLHYFNFRVGCGNWDWFPYN